MSDSMIERLARAFCSGSGLDWDKMPHSNFDDGARKDVITRLSAYNGAKQALHALAIPTAKMSEEGRIQCDVLDNGANRIWDAMIEAALHE